MDETLTNPEPANQPAAAVNPHRKPGSCEKYLSVQGLMQELDICRSTAHVLLNTKRVFPNAFQIGNRWRIPRTDVELYAKSANPYAGRKVKPLPQG